MPLLVNLRHLEAHEIELEGELPVAELDLNPVYVRPARGGCVVLDARIRLASPVPTRPRGARLNSSTLPVSAGASAPGNPPA